eukprot:gene51561-11179_t
MGLGAVGGGADVADSPTDIAPPTDRPDCGWKDAALFWCYCTIDFWCFFTSLFVIRRGGAGLMVLATAYREGYTWPDAVAVVMVLAGFGAYQLSAEGRRQWERREGEKRQLLHDGPRTNDSDAADECGA